jgi:hypothetical protein
MPSTPGNLKRKFRLESVRDEEANHECGMSRLLLLVFAPLFFFGLPALTSAQTHWLSIPPQEGANVSVPVDLHFPLPSQVNTVPSQVNDATLTMVFSTQNAVYPNDENVSIDCRSASGTVLATVVPARLFTGERGAAPQSATWDVPIPCFQVSTVTLHVLPDQNAIVRVTNAWLNYRTGTPALLTDTAQIEGYSNRISVHPGENIAFKINVPQQQNISIDFMRLGTDNVVMTVPGPTGAPIVAVSQPYSTDAYKQGANWQTTYTLLVPATWTSGLYTARLKNASGYLNYVTFVVNEPTPGSTAQLAVLTSTDSWQAYNFWGGGGFYRYQVQESGTCPSSNLSPDPSCRNTRCMFDVSCSHMGFEALPP